MAKEAHVSAAQCWNGLNTTPLSVPQWTISCKEKNLSNKAFLCRNLEILCIFLGYDLSVNVISPLGLKNSAKHGEQAIMRDGVICIVWDAFLCLCQVAEKKCLLRTGRGQSPIPQCRPDTAASSGDHTTSWSPLELHPTS